MPSDGSGVYTLPSGYLATTGQPILASQHNPPLEDIKDALSARLMRSGVAAMTGKLSAAACAAGYASINLAEGTAPSAPVDGDMWVTADHAYVRANGVTADLDIIKRIDAETTETGVASITFTDLPAGTKELKIRIFALQPSVDATNLNMRLSTDNGATYLSGASDYAWQLSHDFSATVSAESDGADSLIQLAQNLDSSHGDCMGEISVFFKASGRAFVRSHIHLIDTTPEYGNTESMGYTEFTCNAVQILPTTGNITVTYSAVAILG
jgi:hypothetical protein